MQFIDGSGYRHVTVTPSTHARVLQNRDADAARVDDIFGWNMAFPADALPAPLFRALRETLLIVSSNGLWRSRVRVSTLAECNFVHSGFPTVEADAVFFGPDTYRFANAVTQSLRGAERPTRALEIGCGSGAVGILLAKAFPEAEVCLGDINESALAMARVNARARAVSNVEVACSDLAAGFGGDFDLIVANPPYLVDPARRAYRNGGGGWGTDLSVAIARCALERLRVGGQCVLYTGAPVVQGVDVLLTAIEPFLVASNVRWTYREVDPDVFGEELAAPPYNAADRIAAVVVEIIREH